MIEGWRRVSVGDLGKIVSGGTPDSTNPAYWDGDIPWATQTDITKLTSRYISSTARRITEAGLKSSSARLVPPGSILVCTRATIGELAIASKTICTNQGFKNLITNSEHDNEFVFYLLQFFKNYLVRYASGSTFHELVKRDFEKLAFLVPPLSEQRKVAKILSTCDEAIETIEKLIVNTQTHKKALKWQLLNGRKRFMTNKREWKVVSFDDVMDIEIGGTPSRNNPAYWDHEKNTENRWISISDLQSPVIGETKEHISDLGVKNSNAKLIPAGSIVMSFKLTIGRTAVLRKDCYTNEAVCALLPKDEKLLLKDYLLQALPYVNYEKEIDRAVKGKTLNKKKLRNLKLTLPPYEEQRRIADVLSTLDSKESILISQLAKLQLEKGELMRVLLTGKRRVCIDDDSND